MADRSVEGRTRQRQRRHRLVVAAYAVVGALSALGGARPTGLPGLDPMVLGSAGAAMAACGVRARTVPLYVAAATAALCQPATVPMALGVVAVVAAVARRQLPYPPLGGALAGGLAVAATVGAPMEPGARPMVAPIVALVAVAWSARRHGEAAFRRRSARVALAVSGVVLCGGILGAVSALEARAHVDRAAEFLESGLDAGRHGDSEGATDALLAARRALARGEASLSAWWTRPAWLVPGVSQNVRALRDVIVVVDELAGVAVDTASSADTDSLGARGGRVDLAAVAALDEPLSRMVAALRGSDGTLAEIGEGWQLPVIRSRIDDLRADVASALESSELALDGVRLAPGFLGGDGQSTYLVLFTTPVEARATTGFPGNFAEVTFTDGRFDMTRFGRITELNQALPVGGATISGPPDYLARYARYEPQREWRNITLSPDFPSVAAVAAEMYVQSGGQPVDGVMSVDPVALAGLLTFTGPMTVPGIEEPLTSENAARFLLRDQYVELPDDPARTDALESLAERAFDRLTTVDLPGPPELRRVLGPIVETGHLQVAAFSDQQAAFLDALGISGRYPAVAGDFLGVTTSNAAGSKIDLFLRCDLAYDVRWDPSTGAVRSTVTVSLTNEAPASGLPDYVIGNALGARLGEVRLPTGSNHVFVTVYTPLEPDSATLDGQPVALEGSEELGRRALSTFVTLGPGATRQLVVELHGVLPERRYVLDLAPQPLVQPQTATVDLVVPGANGLVVAGPVTGGEGRASGSFTLDRDMRISARVP